MHLHNHVVKKPQLDYYLKLIKSRKFWYCNFSYHHDHGLRYQHFLILTNKWFDFFLLCGIGVGHITKRKKIEIKSLLCNTNSLQIFVTFTTKFVFS